MLEILLVAVQILGSLGIALAIAYPRWRPRAAALLLTLALANLAAALTAPEQRQLTVSATFPAYQELLIVPTAFPVEEVSAPGWFWALFAAGFAAAWALWAVTSRRAVGPFVMPLILAWTGTALWLALQ